MTFLLFDVRLRSICVKVMRINFCKHDNNRGKMSILSPFILRVLAYQLHTIAVSPLNL